MPIEKQCSSPFMRIKLDCALFRLESVHKIIFFSQISGLSDTLSPNRILYSFHTRLAQVGYIKLFIICIFYHS